ncbi:MAG: chemotaxis protein CheW [Cyanobacteriota bacterium]
MRTVLENTIDYKEIIQFITFNIDNEIFAINIAHVQEIVKNKFITSVPLTKKYVDGLMNIRGSIIPIINLRKKMLKEKIEDTEDTRIVILNFNKRIVGFIVDNMNQVIRVNKEHIQPPTSSNQDTFMESVYVTKDKFTDDDDENIEKFISILDVNRLMEVE